MNYTGAAWDDRTQVSIIYMKQAVCISVSHLLLNNTTYVV